MLERWRESFPGVDVMQALRSMREWLLAAGPKAKTFRGMPSFVTRWLTREQDKSGRLALVPQRPNPGSSDYLQEHARRLTEAGRKA